MKYRKRNIDDVFQHKNWEGVEPFIDRFGIDQLILLDKVVREKDWEKLKEYVKRFSLDPLLEYGMPVAGEGIRELEEIDHRFHSHKRKVGAQWWLRDEIEDAVEQLKGYSLDAVFLDKVALAWKNVDSQIDSLREKKINAFRKMVVISLIKAIYKPGDEEEGTLMTDIDALLHKSGFGEKLEYKHDFVK